MTRGVKSAPDIFLFEDFRFNRGTGELFRIDGQSNEEVVTVGARAAALLGVLVEHHGGLVSKDLIMDVVWDGRVVEEANLTVQIAALRRILDRDAQQDSVIQTIPGRGYRFVAPVTRPATAQPPSATPIRRLAAIFAADVVGYSRLVENDEEGTLSRLLQIRSDITEPTIAARRGRIVKTTGDGLLVEFASVVDAVRCALSIQSDIYTLNADLSDEQRIMFRIGINLGDIVADGDDILGDGVNIAARLESIAEPGAIYVSAAARDYIGNRLPVSFDDLGEQRLKNIRRPIRVYRVHEVSSITYPIRVPLIHDRPSIAVLPFTNMSGDPEQDYFADGIAEDIITALSRFPSLFVIARNSSFTYKDNVVEDRKIGNELGVRYVLKGSLRKVENRLRVSAQLVEAESGKHVWAERYDRELPDIFAVQDEISQAVTIAIAPAIGQAEQQRAMRKPPDSLDAWASFQRGLRYMSSFSADDNREAQECFERAISLDPNFAGGYWGIAWARLHAAAGLQMSDLAEAQSSAETLARRALQLAGADPEARSCLAFTLLMRGDLDGALAEADEVLAASPNMAVAHGERGAALIFAGRPTEGVEAVRQCMRLDPHDPLLRVRLLHIATGLYLVGLEKGQESLFFKDSLVL